MDRRAFLRTTLGTTAGLAILPGCQQMGYGSAGSKSELKVSLAEWSLHRTLQSGELDNLGFPAAARGFGIGAVEYVNAFFKDKARNNTYLDQLKVRCADAGVQSLLIMCDGEGQLGNQDSAARRKAVENHHKWVEAAMHLGCHSIRVNAAGGGDWDEAMKNAADGLRQLCEYGDDYGINVIVENHGGLSSNGEWLAGVMQLTDHPRVGTLPDFGNFRLGGGKTYDRYVGVTQLMPFAKAVSAKSHEFDEAGNEIHTDYQRMMGIVRAAGYSGYVGIEYEGGKLSEHDGIQATLDLLLRHGVEL